MYLAHLRIQNFRCFGDETIHFRPGVNVLIGENNAGKTTVTRALSLLLEQEVRRRPQFFDFHNPPADLRVPPSIIITATFRSNEADTIEDKALVASWLTRIEPPWEAQLAYTFMLEVDDETQCTKDLQAIAV